MIYETRFEFFDFDMSSQNSYFSLALSSEVVSIGQLGSIAL